MTYPRIFSTHSILVSRSRTFAFAQPRWFGRSDQSTVDPATVYHQAWIVERLQKRSTRFLSCKKELHICIYWFDTTCKALGSYYSLTRPRCTAAYLTVFGSKPLEKMNCFLLLLFRIITVVQPLRLLCQYSKPWSILQGAAEYMTVGASVRVSD